MLDALFCLQIPLGALLVGRVNKGKVGWRAPGNSSFYRTVEGKDRKQTE